MSAVLDIALGLVTFAGHLFLWVTLLNWLHAMALPCRVVDAVEKVIFGLVLALPGLAAWGVAFGGSPPWSTPDAVLDWLPFAYCGVCWVTLAGWIGRWVLRQAESRCPNLVTNDTTRIDVQAAFDEPLIEGFTIKLLNRVPGNEILQLSIHEKVLRLDGLPAPLAGLSIAHLSDLHFTGNLRRPYFEEVVRRTLELDADMIVITGDLIDKRKCFEWIVPVLGRLDAPLGVYSVLGNHDKRLGADADKLRGLLGEAGIIDLGGKSQTLTVRDRRVFLAGNERPWFPAEPPLDEAAAADFRILLAHTPDQLSWARRHGFDLMVAGHTHGGQIRFPLVGPVVAPSFHGVRYASGLFHRPPTLMHVSRGISGLEPIRINCPPELAKLVLTAG